MYDPELSRYKLDNTQSTHYSAAALVHQRRAYIMPTHHPPTRMRIGTRTTQTLPLNKK